MKGIVLFSATFVILLTFFIVFILYSRTGSLPSELQNKKNVWINGQKFNLAIADDFMERSQGLMFVKSLTDNEGMLFLFPNKEKPAFWNKNTLVDLALLWIDDDTIIAIDKLFSEPHQGLMTVRSPLEVNRVVEFPLHTLERYKIGVGDKIEL